jgi:hypothetical protein
VTGTTAPRLRLLAAELRGELTRIERTVAEIEAAAPLLGDPGCPRLALYGAAALLETFYTGIEKALMRVAAITGGMPEGAAWHRKLLEDATLDLPKLRPPVLRPATARLLEPYLAFRHRFRNLYLFDLDAGLTAPLVEDAGPAWEATRADLARFAEALEAIADALDAELDPDR